MNAAEDRHKPIFHSARGHKMFGMIVDPGAASAIMGTDTLREFVNEVLKPKGYSVKYRSTTSRFTGIGGRSDPGVAKASFNIGVPGLSSAELTVDLVGHGGSNCPVLLPLECLLRMQACMLFNVLPHSDGIMILRLHIGEISETLLFIQLYHTDSGHYMMPISDFGRQERSEQSRLRKVVKEYFRTMTQSSGVDGRESAVFLNHALDSAGCSVVSGDTLSGTSNGENEHDVLDEDR